MLSTLKQPTSSLNKIIEIRRKEEREKSEHNLKCFFIYFKFTLVVINLITHVHVYVCTHLHI